MDRRHQVFVSSTFSDLVEERAEIIQALLELDCFPAGMEMFPASTEGAWDLIKGVIDDSDYYCLVIGGRYGSRDEHGLGFTEKEYDYAMSKKKPLIAFLHQNPANIIAGRTEQSEEGRKKLEEFRAKVEGPHHCKYWSTAAELGAKVSRGLVALRKSHPSNGWVPGEYAADENALLEVANLRRQVAELEAQLLRHSATTSTTSGEDLADGTSTYSPRVYISNTEVTGRDKEIWERISTTWDQILSYVGPSLLGECSEEDVRERVEVCFWHQAQQHFEKGSQLKMQELVVSHRTFDQIKVQLRALGYMVPGTRRRPVSDQTTYWKLSQTGEARLLTVQAIKRKISPSTETSEPKSLTSDDAI